MKWSNELEIVRSKFENIGKSLHQYMYECYLKEEFPLDAWNVLANADFMRAIPNLGVRKGIEWLAAAVHGFTFGSQDAAFNSSTIAHAAMGVRVLSEFASSEAKDKYLDDTQSGKSIVAFCITESFGGGTNAFHPHCTIKNIGGKIILNGEKWHITNVPYASLLMVWAHDEDTHGLVCVIVEPKYSGVDTLTRLHPCGAKTATVAPAVFDNVVIPPENIIRFANGAFELNQVLIAERILVAFPSISIAEISIKKALNFIKERRVHGKRLIEYQYKQGELSESQMLQYLLACCAKTTLDKYVAGDCVKLEASVLKAKAIELTSTIVEKCMHACGSYGLQREAQFSMFYNDLLVGGVAGGTADAHRMVVMDEMLRRHHHLLPVYITGEKPWLNGVEKPILQRVHAPFFDTGNLHSENFVYPEVLVDTSGSSGQKITEHEDVSDTLQ